MERCTSCGAILPDAAQFCGYCGRVVITMREMPARMSGYPVVNTLEGDTPTSISGLSYPVPQPFLRSGKYGNSSTRSIWQQGEMTQQIPVSEEEEYEEEERRRVLPGLALLGALADGQAPPVDTPVVHGTPQFARVPLVQGNPAGPARAPALQGAPLSTPTPSQFAPPSAPYTPPPNTSLTHPEAWPPSHPTAPLARPSSPPKHTGSGSGSSRPATGGSCALIALILAIVSLIITGTIGGLVFGVPPAISLAGSSKVTVGEGLHLHGYHFFPGSSITLTLDNRLQLFSAASNTTGETHSYAPSLAALSLDVAGQPAAQSTAIKADGSGSFDIIIPVSSAWGLGSHTLRAAEGISSRSAAVNFTVEMPQGQKAQAKLNVTPSALNFGTLDVGQHLTKALTISNSGNLALNWKANTGNAHWVTLDTTSQSIQPGAPPDTLKVSVDTTNLTPGNQSAALTISSNGGSAQVVITLAVKRVQTPHQQPCTLSAPSSSNEIFNAKVGTDPATQTLTIGVSGSCSSGVTITPTVTMAAGKDWLAVSPPSTALSSGSTTFTVNVTSSALSPGSYTGTISLAAESGNTAIDGSPQTISVTLTVTEVPPVLGVSPATLPFSLSNGDKTTAGSFTISNTGGAALNWTATLDANAPSFVKLAPGAGTNLAGGANTTVGVNVNPSGVEAGNYAATVTVGATDPLTGQDVKGSRATVSVTITITAAPSMQLSAKSVTFTPGNCGYAASSTITVTNTGGGTLSWSVGDPAYPSGSPTGWLSVSPVHGTGTMLKFSVDGTVPQLVNGQTYTATVTITPSAGDPQTVSVSFTVPYCIQ